MAAAKSCPSTAQLKQLLLGQLPQPVADWFAAHLENCSTCAARAEYIDRDEQNPLLQALRAKPTCYSLDDETLISALIEQTSAVIRGLDTGEGVLDESGSHAFTELLAPPQQEDELGRLGGYRVLEVLGKGGMGVVFLAEDIVLRRRVALKVIQPGLASSGEVRRRFMREARAAAAIEDDHVVTIHQVGEDRGVLFIAMQLLHGRSLQDYLRSVAHTEQSIGIPVSEAIHIGQQIARGLASAHACRLIHRDITPANVWLEASPSSGSSETAPGSGCWRVKLLDFGLARELEGDLFISRTGVLAGTPAYLAPEQVLAGTVDERCDLFSLGCVLYEMTTGRSPFASRDSASTLHAITSTTPPDPHQVNAAVPIALSRLVIKLLSKDAAQRPISADEVALQLQAIAADPNSTRRVLASPRRNRRIAALLALLAMAAALGGAAAGAMFSQRFSRDSALLKNANRARSEPKQVDDWFVQVRRLNAAEQVEAVSQKLKELNPNFDGVLRHTVLENAVVEIELETDAIRDITPLRAFHKLQKLVCRGSAPGKGSLDSLEPLHPLAELRSLDCRNNRIENLLPLHELRLQELNCSANPLDDIGPLRDMPLEVLDISRTLVADLQPLRNAPMQQLDIRATQVIDVWPLEEVESLRVLDCYFHAQRDAELLRSLTFLRRLNGQDCEAFWEKYEARQASMSEWLPQVAALSEQEKVAAVAAKLQELNPGFDGLVFPNYTEGKMTVFQVFTDHLTDIEPLRAFTHLERLTIRGTDQGNGKLFDLYPLRGLPLVYLECGFNEITDLRALQGVPLQVLLCHGTLVRDLTPVRDLPLFYFDCTSTPVDDLSPLIGRPISILHIRNTRIRNYSPIARMNVHILGADLEPVGDKGLLRSITTLEALNDVPVAELWN